MIFFNIEQPLKRSSSILSTKEESIVTFFNNEQPLKALLPILKTEAGIVISFKDVHSEND